MRSRSRLGDGTILAVAAVLWTIGTGIAFLSVPVGTSVSSATTSSASSGTSTGVETTEVTTTSSETLLEAEGASVVILLLIPVAIALIAALARGRRRRGVRLGAGIASTAACLVAILTLGFFYLPAALLLLASAIRTPTPPARPTPLQL